MFEVLKRAADGAFAVDDELRIRFWNEAAEEIMGFGIGDVVGQKCYQTLQGYDEESCLICKAGCRVANVALKDEPVPSYDICVRTAQGDRRWLNMSVITSKMGGKGDKKMIVHLFRDISQKKKEAMLFRQVLGTALSYQKIPADLSDTKDASNLIEQLTLREREVLTLLTRGLSTQEVAENLSISRNTARNHIQHILQKLQVHSRLEAVLYALNKDMLS